MVDLYIQSIANSLRQFHALNYPQEHTRLSQGGAVDTTIYFEGLAWDGLRNANVAAWDLLPKQRQDALIAARNKLIQQATKKCKE